jgi:hypothetical protein
MQVCQTALSAGAAVLLGAWSGSLGGMAAMKRSAA